MQVMNDEREQQRRHRALGGASRARLLALLSESGDWLSVHDLAGNAGPRPNTTREHLDQLVEAGFVERERAKPAGRGRPAYRYRARRQVDEAAAYRALTSVLAEELAQHEDPAADAGAAGERWGRRLAQRPGDNSAEPVDRLMVLLDELGFAPSMTDSDARIDLRRCPFVSVARTNGQVVCNVHLGLMRGALSELGSSTDVMRLEPFVEPSLCIAHLKPANDHA